ncbi:MAG: tol-pal system protein YbgF [Gammaproteobacteria bacterium]|nr:tol-pal system protein YbgF [Gammaproteobacteria bacterium]
MRQIIIWPILWCTFFSPSLMAEQKIKPLTFEERLARLERLLESRVLVELNQDVDLLKSELRTLRGELEKQDHVLQSMRKRQRELYQDSDRRLRDLELGAPSPPLAAVVDAGEGASVAELGGRSATALGSASATVLQPVAAAETKTALLPELQRKQKSDYEDAFEQLKNGRYESAIEAFQSFLSRYPTGPYADNAEYWLGETNYVIRHFSAALEHFNAVINNYPDSSKVADARLKVAYTYYEMKEMSEAEKWLRQLIEDAPTPSVVRLAEQRLLMIRESGH